MASVGSRLVEGVAKKQADDFFGKFSEILGGQAEKDVNQVSSVETQHKVEVETEQRGLSPALWGAGLIILVAAVLYIVVG